MSQQNTPDWRERTHRPYPTIKPREEFSRTLEEHLAETGPQVKKIRLRSVLLPAVNADGSPQVLAALSLRRRLVPLASLAFVVLMGTIWALAPKEQSSPQPSSRTSVPTSLAP